MGFLLDLFFVRIPDAIQELLGPTNSQAEPFAFAQDAKAEVGTIVSKVTEKMPLCTFAPTSVNDLMFPEETDTISSFNNSSFSISVLLDTKTRRK